MALAVPSDSARSKLLAAAPFRIGKQGHPPQRCLAVIGDRQCQQQIATTVATEVASNQLKGQAGRGQLGLVVKPPAPLLRRSHSSP